MKYYTIDIKIYNDFGELSEKRLTFPTLDDMSITFTKVDIIDNVIENAREYAKDNNLLLEELYNSEEEAEFNKEDTTDEYRENLTATSDLNNPANFAN
jgi:hypothetical protein